MSSYTITELLDIIAERGKRIAELEADIKEAMEWNWLDDNFETWPEQMNKLADKYLGEQE